MIGQWLTRRQEGHAELRVEPLTPAEVGRLDLGWRSMFSGADLRQHLAAHPGRAFWAPLTREYIVGGSWRHRRAIGSVLELGANGEARAPLMEALAAACAAEGCPLIIFGDTSELRQPRWYAELGFELVQEIIVYELSGPPSIRYGRTPRLRFERIERPDHPALLTVDHDAFPYLWWNDAAEFENYLDQSGVRIYLARDAAGEAIAYAGITLYHGWGHLDRLAVRRDHQGQGYGAEALSFALDQIQAGGARRTALSTQADNRRSQILYERFGFRRTYRTDYRLYGRWLIADEARRREIIGLQED